MEKTIELLHSGAYSCVIANGDNVRTFTKRGIADLYDLLIHETSFLKDASIADKVIGKAAATLLVLGGVKEVYADIISTPALTLLRNNNVKVSYTTEVPFIRNRAQNDWCPMEKICNNNNSLEDNFSFIQNFISTINNN